MYRFAVAKYAVVRSICDILCSHRLGLCDLCIHWLSLLGHQFALIGQSLIGPMWFVIILYSHQSNLNTIPKHSKFVLYLVPALQNWYAIAQSCLVIT